MPPRQAPRAARPAARYWKGKAPKGLTDLPSDSDDDGDSQEQVEHLEDGDVAIQDLEADDDDDLHAAAQTVKSAKGISVTLRDVNISKEGRVTVAGRDESGRTQFETTGTFAFNTCCLYSYSNFLKRVLNPRRSLPQKKRRNRRSLKLNVLQSPLRPPNRRRMKRCVCISGLPHFAHVTYVLLQSSEYETDSEEEEPAKPAFRPVFVPKYDTLSFTQDHSRSHTVSQAKSRHRRRC